MFLTEKYIAGLKNIFFCIDWLASFYLTMFDSFTEVVKNHTPTKNLFFFIAQ